ncbi:MAG: cell division protein SepF [Limnochordales bacterium]|nr:cell division protein SepF [Bacillota bacterium]
MSESTSNGKRFFDKVFHFLGIEHDEAATSEDASPAFSPPREPAPEPRRGRLISLPGARRDVEQMSVVVYRPVSFDDVQMVVDCLKDRRPVILSVELVPKEVARRLVDFVSGAAYALDGRMHRLGEQLFLFTPSNIGIEVPADDGGYAYDDFEVGR